MIPGVFNLAVSGKLFYPVCHEQGAAMTNQHGTPVVATAQIAGTRDYQEDSVAVHALATAAEKHAGELLLVLADGMGGHVGGEIASRLVVEQFCQDYINSEADVIAALRSSLNSANEQLAEAVAETPGLKGMGTTLVGCVIRGHDLYRISVGDSPLWLFRDGSLQRLNADHSMLPLLDEMVRNGEISSAAAKKDMRRHMLRSAVAGKVLELVDLCNEPLRLQADDIVILASDGVETLAEDELIAVLEKRHEQTPQQLADNIMARIGAAGNSAQDNASIILYLCE
jgi:serine/threonine protein phosphatase PrpC